MLHFHLNARGTHTELCLLASCQEGDKYLLLSQDSDPNSFVKGQEDRVQRNGSEAEAAPAPPTHSCTQLIQTLTT